MSWIDGLMAFIDGMGHLLPPGRVDRDLALIRQYRGPDAGCCVVRELGGRRYQLGDLVYEVQADDSVSVTKATQR